MGQGVGTGGGDRRWGQGSVRKWDKGWGQGVGPGECEEMG